jgi:hypothetical protein
MVELVVGTVVELRVGTMVELVVGTEVVSEGLTGVEAKEWAARVEAGLPAPRKPNPLATAMHIHLRPRSRVSRRSMWDAQIP